MGPPDPGERRRARILRALLPLYPAGFRQVHGDEVVRVQLLQRRDARYRDGVRGTVRYWKEVLGDTVTVAASLRWQALAGRRGAASRDTGGRTTMGGMERMTQMMRDMRHAVRGLGRNPGYALVFVLTLGLGIGANTAMFSAVNAVLLKPLPHEDGDRLVYLRHAAPLAGLDNVLFSVPEIEDLRSGVSSLAAVAEFSSMNFTMLGQGDPRRVTAGIVTGNYFGVMGLEASTGRVIGEGDDGEEAPPVIVLSDRYWRNTFGADPGVVGRVVEMNGRSATVVGVADPAPPYPEATDIYVNMAASPHHLSASMNHDRRHRMTEVFARLAPGASAESVRPEVEAIARRSRSDHPGAYDEGSGYEVTVTPLKRQLTERARPTLLLLLGTATLVLLIACANLANLTFTRVLRRGQELSIRLSLGGTRWGLRRGLLAESLILAAVGAVVGVLFASVSLDLIIAYAERFTVRASEIALDGTVLSFALLAAVGASLFFTFLPALPGSTGIGALTRSGTRLTIGGRARTVQRALVVAQIGSSFVLLMGAGLLVRTMIHLARVDPGYDTAEVLAMDIPARGNGLSDEENRVQYLGILDGVESLPGVERAALTTVVPLQGGRFSSEFEVEGHEPQPGAPTPRAELRVISPAFFETLGIELLAGRGFRNSDLPDAPKVVVINEAMAREFFGGRDPVGGQLAWTNEMMEMYLGVGPEWRTVVGVVRDYQEGLDAPAEPTVYNMYGQIHLAGSMVVRLLDSPEVVMPGIREVVLSFDPNQPIDNVATIEALGSDAVAPQRLNAILLGGFALLALLIASVGIGGVLAFSVSARTREFGIRGALGAARHQIWGIVLAEGATLAGGGVALGVVGALLLTRFIAGLLVEVPALDPVTFVAVGLLLGAVAIGAASIPALRAAAVDPIESLNRE